MAQDNRLWGAERIRGDLKVRVHREVQGTIKTVTTKRGVNQWDVPLSGEVEEEPLPPWEEAVGIDLGLLHFATRSTGETIENPRPYRRGLKRIKRCNSPRTANRVGPIGASAPRLRWQPPTGECAPNDTIFSTKPPAPW